jgi:hypothetical protein
MKTVALGRIEVAFEKSFLVVLQVLLQHSYRALLLYLMEWYYWLNRSARIFVLRLSHCPRFEAGHLLRSDGASVVR